MNSVLSEILETGVTSASGNVKVHSAISLSEGQFLQKLVREVSPTVSLEVGLPYGISALFICGVLKPGSQHIVIDPYQNTDSWDGIGIKNLRQAGYDDMVRLIEQPSYRALPQLEAGGQRIDFAFIDGWHTFDFTLVDFFFIDQMLKVGGIVAFDDANWPAIRRVCRFVKTNLAYSAVGAVASEYKPSMIRRIAEHLPARRLFSKFLRPDIVNPDRSVGLAGNCIAFRKEAEDGRGVDHFVEF